jgi:hypothetical protein
MFGALSAGPWWWLAGPRNADPAVEWAWWAFPIERGFADHGDVRGFVEPNHDPLVLDFDIAAGFHHPLDRLLRHGLPTAEQPRRQPAIATVGNHRQRRVEIHVEADFAGQAVEMEEIHTDPRGVFHAIWSHRARDQFAGLGLEMVGQANGWLVTAHSRHCQLPKRIGIAANLYDFEQITMNTFYSDILFNSCHEYSEMAVDSLRCSCRRVSVSQGEARDAPQRETGAVERFAGADVGCDGHAPTD